VVSDDPVLYVLEDSIGIESALRVGTGSFELTANGKFPDATKVFITTSPLKTITKEVRAYRLNTNVFRFDTYLSGTITDGILISTEPLSLMIEVYP